MAQIKILILSSFLCFFTFSADGQRKQKIIYTIPPMADSFVYNYINLYKQDNSLPYVVLQKLTEDNYCVTVDWRMLKSEKIDYWIDKVVFYSNRYLRLSNKINIPILINDFDDVFVDQKYGDYIGGLTSYITHEVRREHTLVVVFTLNNKIIKVSYNGG